MKIERYDFGTLRYGDRFIIGEMNEGANITLDIVSFIGEQGTKAFQGQKWTYISHRINSYSLDPTFYVRLARQEGCRDVSVAIVLTQPGSEAFVEIEKDLAKDRYDFACFDRLNDAVEWAGRFSQSASVSDAIKALA